jgi:phosphoribosylformylglycinamidine cyclo-ligase
MNYENSGVNISLADQTKKEMANILSTQNQNPNVLNQLGAFASLYDINFLKQYNHPILVTKTEEPGSKQLIASKYNKMESICYDMINHLVNDIIVMGAKPLAVQDAIICGKLDKDVISLLVDSISKACQAQGCVLTGGETSEQPNVIDVGTYILTSSIVGIVEKDRIIDGSEIKEGNVIIALPSNGLHTNGYSLVRALMEQDDFYYGQQFIEQIMIPHKCYYQELKQLFSYDGLHGMAHITGGGIQGNLNRILPDNLDAEIDLSSIRVLNIFKTIRKYGDIIDSEMLRTFNCGVGMCLVVDKWLVNNVLNCLSDSYIIGRIIKGNKNVVFKGNLNWSVK